MKAVKKSRGRPISTGVAVSRRTPIGVLIRTARVGKKKSLAQVAAALGTSVAYISNVEHGRAPLSLKYSAGIAKFLGISKKKVLDVSFRSSAAYARLAAFS